MATLATDLTSSLGPMYPMLGRPTFGGDSLVRAISQTDLEVANGVVERSRSVIQYLKCELRKICEIRFYR
jgi:hypothetical protein